MSRLSHKSRYVIVGKQNGVESVMSEVVDKKKNLLGLMSHLYLQEERKPGLEGSTQFFIKRVRRGKSAKRLGLDLTPSYSIGHC